jgi:hypothetical protein
MDAQVLSPTQVRQVVVAAIFAVLALIFAIHLLRDAWGKSADRDSLIMLLAVLVAVLLFGAAVNGGDCFWCRNIGKTRG